MAVLRETGRNLTHEGTSVVQCVRRVAIVFDRNNSAEWGHDLAIDALDAGGYAAASAGPGDASGLTLRLRDIDRDPDAAHIYRAVLTYDAKETSRSGRVKNEEVIVVDGHILQDTEYYEITAAPGSGRKIPAVNGSRGVPVVIPGKDFIIKRYHTLAYFWSTLDAAIDAFVCKVNSGTVTTQGGKTLSTVADELMLLYATMEPTTGTMCEVCYHYEKDIARVNLGTSVVSRLHHVFVVQEDKATGQSGPADGPYYAYEQAAIGGAMKTEP